MESIDDEKGKTIKMRVIENDVKLISEICFLIKCKLSKLGRRKMFRFISTRN